MLRITISGFHVNKMLMGEWEDKEAKINFSIIPIGGGGKPPLLASNIITTPPLVGTSLPSFAT